LGGMSLGRPAFGATAITATVWLGASRFAADRAVVQRYATDPAYRASLITKKVWEKNAGR
jgi:hypothetical protein